MIGRAPEVQVEVEDVDCRVVQAKIVISTRIEVPALLR
jgi:hypothetical protein